MASAASRDTQYWAVVPAAGAGRRMGAELPKQYLTLAGRTVLEHTLDALLACELLAGIVVVVAGGDTRWAAIAQHYRGRPLASVTGGAERCQSGFNENGGLLGVPVADTMKRVDAGQRITQTVERDGLWHALTPQLFRLDLLRAALADAIDRQVVITDEASAMEHAGYAPRMVQGSRDNIKITLPADLALAAFYLQARRAQ